MNRESSIPWAERLAELVGAVALAVGAGLSAGPLATRLDLMAVPIGLAAALFGGAIGWLVMRAVPSPVVAMPIAAFAVQEIAPTDITVEPAVLLGTEAMLLDDALAAPTADSRVVALFAPDRQPTAGDMQQRIERHLDLNRDSPLAEKFPDATEALHAALAEIRRTLRQN